MLSSSLRREVLGSHIYLPPLPQRRHYTPMTEEEEKQEKQRVAGLTAFQKDQELRQLNRQIARLEKMKGINTGELYTWSGRYKVGARLRHAARGVVLGRVDVHGYIVLWGDYRL
jgi:hypothetical protein